MVDYDTKNSPCSLQLLFFTFLLFAKDRCEFRILLIIFNFLNLRRVRFFKSCKAWLICFSRIFGQEATKFFSVWPLYPM